MAHVLVRHKVADFDTWKPFFDEDAENRTGIGSKGGVILRDENDPNNLYLLFETDDLEAFKQFGASPELREVMVKAGVVDHPDMVFSPNSVSFSA